MLTKLNHFLANLVVEYHKLQNFHWYAAGGDFFTVHAKLEEYYDGINEAIDEVAEKILMLEGRPLGSLKEFLETASIQEASDEYRSSQVILDEVQKDFQILLNEAVSIKQAADEGENHLISSAMDSYIETFSKSIWMLKQRARSV